MEPFGQIHDPTRSGGQQGTGLGLPLTKAMAELHGGRLELESDTGKGTKITITFPKDRVRQQRPVIKQENPIMDIERIAD
jgi:two-component system cell cycle sensor histidine kinase PleC